MDENNPGVNSEMVSLPMTKNPNSIVFTPASDRLKSTNSDPITNLSDGPTDSTHFDSESAKLEILQFQKDYENSLSSVSGCDRDSGLSLADEKKTGAARIGLGVGPNQISHQMHQIQERQRQLDEDEGENRSEDGFSNSNDEELIQETMKNNVHSLRSRDSLSSLSSSDWETMPTVASYDIYNLKNDLIATEASRLLSGENDLVDAAGKGYTRVTRDDDAKSINSMDENTSYLFDQKKKKNNINMENKHQHSQRCESDYDDYYDDYYDNDHDNDDDDDGNNILSQLQTTKNILSDKQRIAYVGLSKLVLMDMATELVNLSYSSPTMKKRRLGRKSRFLRILSDSQGSMAIWSQKVMLRLYAHMEITHEEQIMVEQLSTHGVEPTDLTTSLIEVKRVENPINKFSQDNDESLESIDATTNQLSSTVKSPQDIVDEKTLDIDIRWTVLCDLFLVLIADSVYDARSRTFLEKVGAILGITWIDIAQFERKVTDSLEIEESSLQTWDEVEIIKNHSKRNMRKKYIYMGLATLGGGLVLGLSAGLLAPVIGAGLAAGFTTIGVTGTAGFLAGTGGAAVVTTTSAAIGGRIGLQGMAKRMGDIKTFEFKPIHNSRRVNLIVTVSGWMSGKADDVRLPFSTVDPLMGDIYSLLWEPEMLQSMGQTINILATEVLAQSVQQILGQTVLTALMASLQLPMALSKLSYLLDNPWNVSLDRAWSCGLVLADTLIKQNLGVRPVTLVGFSLGARVIYSCLVELAKRGAYGLVQDVYLFGAPVVIKRDEFIGVASVISGKFVNGYSKSDWVLGYLFRATGGGLGKVAGLAPIDNPLAREWVFPESENENDDDKANIHRNNDDNSNNEFDNSNASRSGHTSANHSKRNSLSANKPATTKPSDTNPTNPTSGIINFNNTRFVQGHMGYREAIPKILKALGWKVLNDEFHEIEDPDPEKLRERQKEMIIEFDQARKELEKTEKERERLAKLGIKLDENDSIQTDGKSGSGGSNNGNSGFWGFLKPKAKKKDWWENIERRNGSSSDISKVSNSQNIQDSGSSRGISRVDSSSTIVADTSSVSFPQELNRTSTASTLVFDEFSNSVSPCEQNDSMSNEQEPTNDVFDAAAIQKELIKLAAESSLDKNKVVVPTTIPIENAGHNGEDDEDDYEEADNHYGVLSVPQNGHHRAPSNASSQSSIDDTLGHNYQYSYRHDNSDNGSTREHITMTFD